MVFWGHKNLGEEQIPGLLIGWAQRGPKAGLRLPEDRPRAVRRWV